MNLRPLKKYEIFDLLNKITFPKLKSEKIKLSNSLGRILSNDLFSNINLPPFNNSAVDGYCLHKSNLKQTKKIKCITKIAAGDKKEIKLNKNQTIRIFTGARMPKNCYTVIMQENVTNLGEAIYINKFPEFGENCRLAGEDISKGDLVLESGQKIDSTNFNLIAAIGKRNVNVRKKIKIGFFTSGNELTEPKENLVGAEINNSNKYSLKALLKDSYIDSTYLGNLKDSKEKVIKSLSKNLKKYDVLITTGGASVGEEDHIINVMKEKGEVFFWKTAIKPGRPLAIGKINKTILICLPGNPVSVHLLYGMIIKPFIEFLCGSKMKLPKCIKAKVNFSMKKKTKRMEWVRVVLDSNKLRNYPVNVNKYRKQGSGMISSIAFSDGIIEIPEEVNKVKKGDLYNLYLFEQIFN